jgi:hypothetical protein
MPFMKRTLSVALITMLVSLNHTLLCAQDNSQSCKVITSALIGEYKGGCKKGLASGQGEAKGITHYTGAFKNGMPNGEGIYYYNDSIYYSGELQDGIKEGKGEMHYLRKGIADSIVKGYWSGDEYKGKNYITYESDAALSKFTSADFAPSDGSGSTLTINIITTSGAPDGTPSTIGGDAGFILNITQLNSMNGDNPRMLLKNVSTFQSSIEFELHKFPAILQIIFSDGQVINLELYKSADWRARFYLNR